VAFGSEGDGVQATHVGREELNLAAVFRNA
jgi:hypothetical protein